MPSSNRNIEVMKKLLLIILLLTQSIYADEVKKMETIDGETIISEYGDGFNAKPKGYKLMDSKTPINIEFTDVIDGRYMVDVEWFPDWRLAPLLTGPANINFKLVNRDVKFSVKADLFHIERQIKAKNITSKEAIKINSSELTSVPFNFRDVNFDGINELVITNREGGQRFNNSYTIYLIQEIEGSNYFNVLDLSNTMPYSKFDALTKFNSEDKTVWMEYSGGACSSSYETYKRVFSDYPLEDYKFELIKKIDYESWDDDLNDIPCSKYVYDVVDGKEILIESESGPVN